MTLKAYQVVMIDSEDKAAWMGAAHILSVKPAGQGVSIVGDREVTNCAWIVVTGDYEALEAALDDDADVLSYRDLGAASCTKHEDCRERPELGAACLASNGWLIDSDTTVRLRAATPEEAAESASAPSGHIDVNGVRCYVEA